MAKFKIGDKVRFKGTSTYNFGGTIGTAEAGQVFTISAAGPSRFTPQDGVTLYSVEGSYDQGPNWTNMEDNFELVAENKPKQSLIMKIGIAFKKAVSADLQMQIKAGFRDEALNLTEDGKTALLEIIASSPANTDYQAAFAQAANEIVPKALE